MQILLVFNNVFSFDCRVYSVMHKYLNDRNEITFSGIFDQKIGMIALILVVSFYCMATLEMN